MRTKQPDRGNRYCGHSTHDLLDITVELQGRPEVHEFPAIPDRLARTFRMRVYDYAQYRGFAGYCTGQDIVSEGLHLSGCWEGFDTLLTLAVLDDAEPGLVVDVGAHIGWYTLLATSCGHRVLAIDADTENLSVLRINASAQNVGHLVETRNEWIGEGWKCPGLVVDEVLLLKSDIEGAEGHLVEGVYDLLKRRQIRYLLLEVSPTLAPGYAETVGRVMDCGYEAAIVPSKPPSHVREAYEADPLLALGLSRVDAPLRLHAALGSRRGLRVDRAALGRAVESEAQSNWFFWRSE